MSPQTKPLPRITPDSLPYRCDGGEPHLAPGPVGPACLSDRLAWRAASGRARMSTWTVVHTAWCPAFAAHVPYKVARVEVDAEPRLTASVVGLPDDRLAVGLAVVIDFGEVRTGSRCRASDRPPPERP